MDFVLQWVDLIWLPVAFFTVARPHRLLAVGFCAASMIMMRLMAELMGTIGYPYGIIGLLKAPVLIRGQVIYSVFYLLFLLVAFLSPGSSRAVFMAASITIFFAAAFTFSLVMVL